MDDTNLYIDGDWQEGAGQERFDVLNPATEAVIASVASADIAMQMPHSMRQRRPWRFGPLKHRGTDQRFCVKLGS